MNIKLAIAGALLALGLATPAMAHPFPTPISYPPFNHSWDLIGSTNVSFRAERDTVFAWGHQRYRQIKICVYRQPVRMFDVDVRFHNGGRQDVNVTSVLGQGQCTRAIDLHGNRRDIKSVSFAYRSLPTWRRNDQALVRVYAR